MEWQPIETAPKDGTNILLYINSYNINYIAIGYWTEDEYWCVVGGDESYPIKWMPLPEPPEVKDGME